MKIIIANIFFLSVVGLIITAWQGGTFENFESNKQELGDMEFTRSAYPPDHALVLRATLKLSIEEDLSKENVNISVEISTDRGDSASVLLKPWSNLSNEEMVKVIKDGPGDIVVRIKDADKGSAKNNTGELTRSEKAIENFVNWVDNHEKLSILRTSNLQPDIDIRFAKEITEDLVNQVRMHENVEFIEPNQYGKWMTTTSLNKTNRIEGLAAVISHSNLFTYQVGDTVTAEFQKSDGTILKTSTMITK